MTLLFSTPLHNTSQELAVRARWRNNGKKRSSFSVRKPMWEKFRDSAQNIGVSGSALAEALMACWVRGAIPRHLIEDALRRQPRVPRRADKFIPDYDAYYRWADGQQPSSSPVAEALSQSGDPASTSPLDTSG